MKKGEINLADLGKAISECRLKRGWNVKDLSDLLSVDPTTLARWEKGDVEPRILAFRRLCMLLPEIKEEYFK